MDSSRQIKWGALLSYVAIATNMLAGLLYTPWMIEQIGQSHYGIYTLAHSLISLFLVDFGLSSATARYVSKYRAENKPDKIDSFLGSVYKLYLIIDAIIFVILAGVYLNIDIIYVRLTPEELPIFKAVYVISAMFSVLNFPFVTLSGILTAYEKFIQLKISDVIYRVMVVVLTVIALLMGWGIFALVSVNVFAGLLVTIYKLILVNRMTPTKVNFRNTDKGIYKEIFSFSIWVTVSTLAQRLIFNITPSILGMVASSSAIAIFGIVTTIEGYAYTITNAINGLFMPKISRILTQENSQENLMTLMLRVGRFQYALNGLIVVGFATIGRAFIDLWVGPAYESAYVGILLVIIPGLFFNSLQIANTAMIVQKKVHIQAYITLATGVVNLILSPILASRVGVLGACLSIFIAYMLRAVLCNVVYSRALDLDIKSFIKKCYLGMLPPLILSLFVGWSLNQMMSGISWISMIIKGVVILICYLLSVYLFSLSSNEKAVLNRILKKQ